MQSLALLEPALVTVIPNASEFMGSIGSAVGLYGAGDKHGAIDVFLTSVAGSGFRAMFDRMPGAYEMALADGDTFFRVELPALGQWSFSRDDAARIRPPVLAILGAESAPVFPEIHKLVQAWMPGAQPATIPKANHMLQAVEPRAIAEALANFFAKHPMR